jgi:hypothetical protein
MQMYEALVLTLRCVEWRETPFACNGNGKPTNAECLGSGRVSRRNRTAGVFRTTKTDKIRVQNASCFPKCVNGICFFFLQNSD